MTENSEIRTGHTGTPLTIFCRRPSGPPRMNHRWDGQTCCFCGMDKADRYASQPPPVNLIAAADALADAVAHLDQVTQLLTESGLNQRDAVRLWEANVAVTNARKAYREARGARSEA